MGVIAFGANSFAPSHISFEPKRRITTRTVSGLFRIVNLVEVTAFGTNENVFRVSNILRQQISREKIEINATTIAVLDFYPEKAFHGCILIAVEHTCRPI